MVEMKCWKCGIDLEPGCTCYAPDEFGQCWIPVCKWCYEEETYGRKRRNERKTECRPHPENQRPRYR